MKSKILEQSQPVRLTWRQKQCLVLVAEGNTAKGIALELGISIRTVREHLHRARIALGATSVSQAIYLANKMGILN